MFELQKKQILKIVDSANQPDSLANEYASSLIETEDDIDEADDNSVVYFTKPDEDEEADEEFSFIDADDPQEIVEIDPRVEQIISSISRTRPTLAESIVQLSPLMMRSLDTRLRNLPEGNERQQLVEQRRQLEQVVRDLASPDSETVNRAVRTGYPIAVQWIRENTQGIFQALTQQQLAIPGGAPVPLPDYEPGGGRPSGPVSYRDYAAMLLGRSPIGLRSAEGQFALPLSADTRIVFGADTNEALTETLRFRDAVQWCVDSETFLGLNALRGLSTLIGQDLRAHGFPEQFGPPNNPDELPAWYGRALRLTNVMNQVSDVAQAIVLFNGRHPGVNLASLNQLRDLGVQVQLSPDRRSIVNISFRNAFDDNLTGSRFNNQQLEALEQWIATHSTASRAAIENLGQVRSRALLDGHIGPDGMPMPYLRVGQQTLSQPATDRVSGREYDLIVHGLEIEESNGQILVYRTTSFRHRNLLSYQNFVTDEVRTVRSEEPLRFDPNDFIPVMSHTGRTEFVRAADLRRFRNWEQYWVDYGGRIAGVAMDVGMVVTGLAAARTAIVAGRTGVAALNLGRAGIGAAGILEPALAQWQHGEDVMRLRHMLILADVSGQMGVGVLRRCFGASTAVAHEVSMVTRISGGGMHAGNLVFLPILLQGTIHNFQGGAQNPIPEIGRLISQVPERAPNDAWINALRNPQMMGGIRTVLSDYERNLSQGAPEAVQTQIREIFSELRRVLDPSVPQAERDAFIRGLVPLLVNPQATANGIRQNILNTSVSRRPHSYQIPDAVTGSVSAELTNVRAAAAIALLYATTNGGGQLPEGGVLASAQVRIPGFTYDAAVSTDRGGAGFTVSVPERDSNVSIRTEDVLRLIDRGVNPGTDMRLQLVVAEQMWQRGRMTSGELGAVYRRILETSTDESLRARVIAGAPGSINMTVLINELRVEENGMQSRSPQEQQQYAAQNFGVSSTSLSRLLDEEVRNTRNSVDFRALCAASRQALDQTSPDVFASTLATWSQQWLQLSSQPGQFARAFQQAMQADLSTANAALPILPNPLGGISLLAEVGATAIARQHDSAERRFRAAIALNDMGVLTPRAYNEALLNCLDLSRPDLAQGILSRLNYENLTLAERERLVDLVAVVPATNDNVMIQLAIFRKLPQILQLGRTGVDEGLTRLRMCMRDRVVNLLSEQTSSRDGMQRNPLFPAAYPALRVAALETLGQLGDNSTAVRAVVIDRLRPPVNGVFPEPSPAVRRAAIDVLNNLNLPRAELRRILEGHLTNERDPMVARFTSDILDSLIPERLSTTQATLPPGTNPIRLFSDAEIDERMRGILGPLLRELETFGQVQDRLYGVGFSRRFSLAWDRVSSFSMDEPRLAIEREMQTRRTEYWNMLDGRNPNSIIARANSSDAAVATEALQGLAWVLRHPERIADAQLREQVLSRCADELIRHCVRDSRYRGVAADLVVRLMTQLPSPPPEIMHTLRWGVRGLSQPDAQGNRAITDVQASVIFATALRRSVDAYRNSTANGAEDESMISFQREMMYEIRRLGLAHPMVVETLNYIRTAGNSGDHAANVPRDRRVRAASQRTVDWASSVLGYLHDGTEIVRRHQQPNHVLTPERGVNILRGMNQEIVRSLIERTFDANNFLPAIVGACPAESFSLQSAGGQGDARLPHLRGLMQEAPREIGGRALTPSEILQFDRIRMTATMQILNQGPGRVSADDFAAATRSLVSLTNSTNATIREEANSALRDLRLNGHAALVENARQMHAGRNDGIDWFLQIVSDTFRPNMGVETEIRRRNFGNAEIANLRAIADGDLTSLPRDPIEHIFRACLFDRQNDSENARYLPGDSRLQFLASILRSPSSSSRLKLAAATMLARYSPDRSQQEESANLISAAGNNR